MKAVARVGRALASIIGPIAAWLALVAIGPRLPSLTPINEFVNLGIVSASLVMGFWLLAGPFPRHRWKLGCLYFPAMLVAMIYLGVLLAWRLYPETF
jgi:hypothetical protein